MCGVHVDWHRLSVVEDFPAED